jgi:predicted DNA-binding protein (UPF0251 family)
MAGADEQSSARFRVLVKFDGETETVMVRVDRPKRSGLADVESIILTPDEAEALRIALANALD